jgi:hypothetical protein
MKLCPLCNETKPRDQYRSRSNGKPAGYCKPCEKSYKAERYRQTAEHVRARTRAWAAANKERKRAMDREYGRKNRAKLNEKLRERRRRKPEVYQEIQRRYYAKNREKCDERSKKWMLDHPHHVSERSRRLKVSRKQAYVAWASRDAMAALYREAARLTLITGIPHEVDHIVPLTSKVVCGLHWEGNMRVVPRRVNRSKINRLIEAEALAA